MIVLFHENVSLLPTYKFIIIPIKYRNFGAFVYDSAEKQMLNAISLVIEQRKTEFDRIAKVRVSPIFLCLARVISLSGHLPRSIFSREGDIASTQSLLINFKPIICKLNYSHVIIVIRAMTSSVEFNIMCPGWATCLPVGCCVSKLALLKCNVRSYGKQDLGKLTIFNAVMFSHLNSLKLQSSNNIMHLHTASRIYLFACNMNRIYIRDS